MKSLVAVVAGLAVWVSAAMVGVDAFTVGPMSIRPSHQPRQSTAATRNPCWRLHATSGEPTITITRISDSGDDGDDAEPIPFLDQPNNSFIECYADAVATFDDGSGKGSTTEYTIGVPCDYCVALCYKGDDGELVPIELEDELMDDVFSIAENIVAEEFDDELGLQRTPQTLTLVGELEEDDEDDEDEDAEDDEDDDEDDDEFTGEEEVELLLAFEHRDREFSLVRFMDPVLIVGKADPERPDIRVLLSPEESEWVMPLLESAFLKYSEEEGELL